MIVADATVTAIPTLLETGSRIYGTAIASAKSVAAMGAVNVGATGRKTARTRRPPYRASRYRKANNRQVAVMAAAGAGGLKEALLACAMAIAGAGRHRSNPSRNSRLHLHPQLPNPELQGQVAIMNDRAGSTRPSRRKTKAAKTKGGRAGGTTRPPFTGERCGA